MGADILRLDSEATEWEDWGVFVTDLLGFVCGRQWVGIAGCKVAVIKNLFCFCLIKALSAHLDYCRAMGCRIGVDWSWEKWTLPG